MITSDISKRKLRKTLLGLGMVSVLTFALLWVMKPNGPTGADIRTREEMAAEFETELISYSSPAFDIPHQSGGFLRISASKIRTGISIKVIKLDQEHSDVLEITKLITDEENQSHIFTTHISAYDLWDAVSDGLSWSEDAFMESWHLQKGQKMIPLASDIYVWSDGRDPRVMGLYTGPEKTLHLFAINEKYFNATIDLFIVRRPPLENGHQSSDSIVARIVPVQSFTDATGKFELAPETPIMVTIPNSLLLFSNNLSYGVVYEEEGPTWYPPVLPVKIEVNLAENNSGEPQPGVLWLK